MPKVYTEHYLKTLNREKLRNLILEWQESSLSDPAKQTSPVESVLIYNIINEWAGKLIGRKVNNIQPGPPGPLENVVKDIMETCNNA